MFVGLAGLETHAQNKKTRILFILDASSSMTYEWNKDYNRFGIARNILLQIVDSIYAVNNEVEFGVRAYGTEYNAQDKNCTDSRLLVPFNLQNVNQIKQSLRYTEPIGWSPIAYSLQQAAQGEVINTQDYDYSIIFITDGGESCGGDICKTFLELLQKKVSVTPYIIGLDNNENLKSYYECLGKFVPVLAVDDIPKAVKLIVDENRPILNKDQQLNLTTVFSNSPVKKDTNEKKLVLTPTPTTKPAIASVPLVVEKTKIDSVVNEKEVHVFPRLKLKDVIRSKYTIPKQTPLAAASIVKQVKFNFGNDDIEEPRKQESNLKTIQPFAPRYRFVYAYREPVMTPTQPLFKAVKYQFEIEPIVVKKVIDETKPIVPPKNESIVTTDEANTGVSTEIVPNDETMVQIFLVNKYRRDLKYTSATPTILVQDALTKTQVDKFIRRVSGGKPIEQKIKEGTYNFMIRGDNRIVTPNVKIVPNAINKVYIEVTDGTIEFAYKGNLKRPVSEFQAIVNPRFESKGKTVIQECKDKRVYPPATYYIEINTLPAEKFAMVELQFGVIKSIQIDEPGFLLITNTNNLGKVEFTHELNDADVQFHAMEISGNVLDQKLRLQPGGYKVVYPKDPRLPQLGNKVINFLISSNKTTELKLE